MAVVTTNNKDIAVFTAGERVITCTAIQSVGTIFAIKNIEHYFTLLGAGRVMSLVANSLEKLKLFNMGINIKFCWLTVWLIGREAS